MKKINGYLPKFSKHLASTTVNLWQFNPHNWISLWINQYPLVRILGHDWVGSSIDIFFSTMKFIQMRPGRHSRTCKDTTQVFVPSVLYQLRYEAAPNGVRTLHLGIDGFHHQISHTYSWFIRKSCSGSQITTFTLVDFVFVKFGRVTVAT